MKFSFRKRKPETQRHSQDEAIMNKITVGELTVPAFSALIDSLVDVRVRILKDELHLLFDEQLKAKDAEIKALKASIKKLNAEIETVIRPSRKSEWSGKPRSAMTDPFHN